MQIQDLLSNPDYSQKSILQKLICSILNISREQLRIDGSREISPTDFQKIISGYHAYIDESKPIEYILGYVEFFGNKFIVNQNTIVPRPETEYMINAVTEYCQNNFKDKSDNILMDIGTGSGVLGISVLLQNPDAFQTAFLTDYSPVALEVAKQNYQNLIGDTNQNIQSKVEFVYSDLLDFIEQQNFEKQSNIILLGNLPYIPEQTHDENNPDSVKKREPRMAFVGGEDGLIYYYKMFDQIIKFDLKNITMFLEMMTRQVDILGSKYSEIFVFEEVKTFHFNIRIVKVWYK